jgi:predicted acyltransferase
MNVIGPGAAAAIEAGLPAPARPWKPTATPGRIISLDWARGTLILFNLVAISAVWGVWPAFVHATWDEGVTVFDLIFPTFVTFSGASLAFAFRNQVRWPRIARRAVVLLAGGLAYNACHTYLAEGAVSAATLRITGPLTTYAVLVPVIAVLHQAFKSWQWWLLFTVAVAITYTVVLNRYAAGCPGGILTLQCNPSRAIDASVLGTAHIYGAGTRGHDPEGVVATLGALISAAAGVTLAHLMLWTRGRGSRCSLLGLGGLACALWLLGTVLEAFVPEFKRLWTPPFALHVAAGVVLVLAVGSAVLERAGAHPRWRQVVWPLVGLGRNAIVFYFGAHLLLQMLHTRGDLPGRPWIVSWAEGVAVWGAPPQVGFTVTFVAGALILAAVLHRLGIYIRP